VSEHEKGRWGRRLVVLGVVTALGLGAGELWLRTLTPLELGFGYTDGRFHHPAEFDRDGTLNRLGYHDAEPPPRAPDAARVVLLGDSYVEADSVPVDATVGSRLEHHLGPGVDVVALGRSGWGQAEELAALEEHGPALAPDLVVTLFLPFNDVRNNHARLQELALAQLATMSRFRPGWSSFARKDARFLLFEGSALNRLLSHRLTRAAARAGDELPIDYRVYASASDATWEEAWRRTEELLVATHTQSEALGARYAVVCASTPHGVLGPEAGLDLLREAYPVMAAEEFDLGLPAARLAALCEEHGIPFLDLEPLLARLHAREGTALHWRHDGHWNAAGNDAAARELASFASALLGN
jgi:hypothetical protein